LVLPPHRLTAEVQVKIKEVSDKMAKMLNISGPFNSQFIITPDGEVLVIECNVRASRSLPFMAKTIKQDMVDICGKVLLGQDMSEVKPVDATKLGYYGVKAPQFSWTRLKGCDPRCGVEMSSTGEVATFAQTPEEGYLMAQHATHQKFPHKRVMLSAVSPKDVEALAEVGRDCAKMNYELVATEPVSDALTVAGIAHKRVTMEEGVELLKSGGADSLFCIPSKRMEDSAAETTPDGNHFTLRRAAVDYSTPVQTELEVVRMYVRALSKTTGFNTESHAELANWHQ